MKKKVLVSFIFIIFFTSLLSSCGNKDSVVQKKELKKFNVGYLATPGHALYFVAKEKGYFEEEGLDAELSLFTNSGEGLNAISAGKLDAGAFGTAAPLTFISKGIDFTIFGGQQTEGHGIIALPEKASELSDIKNFKGKKVATIRLATGDVVFRAALKESGIDWQKDLTINELDSPAAVLEAVKKGSVDAGIVWTPFIKLGEKQGLKIVMYSGDMLDMHPCCRQVALTSKINENQSDYVKFQTALIKAYKFYLNNQDETVEIISKYAKIDKDIIKAETYSGQIFSVPDPDKNGVIKFWDIMNSIGYISSDIKIENNINTNIYKKALDDLIAKYPDDKVYNDLKTNFKE